MPRQTPRIKPITHSTLRRTITAAAISLPLIIAGCLSVTTTTTTPSSDGWETPSTTSTASSSDQPVHRPTPSDLEPPASWPANAPAGNGSTTALPPSTDGGAATAAGPRPTTDSGLPALRQTEVDRRVIVGIRAFNGDPADPTGRGRVKQWRAPDARAMRWFESVVDEVAAAGARRVVLLNPAGSIGRFPPDPLRFMDPARKSAIAASIARLKQRWPDLQIGVYVGSGLDPEPGDIEHAHDAVTRPNFNNAKHRARFLDNYRDLPSLGFDLIFIDNITGKGGGARPNEWLALVQDTTGLPTYGEAYPTTEDPDRFPRGPGGRHVGADRERADSWRYMALSHYIDSRNITTDGTREHYAGFNNHDDRWAETNTAGRVAMLREFIQRGFVPFIYYRQRSDSARLVEQATRLLQQHDSGNTR